MRKIILFFLTFSLFVTATLFSKDREVIIKLKDNSVLNSTTIKLKDIGMVIGDNRLNNLTLVKFSSQSDSFLINRQLVLNEVVNFYEKRNEKVPFIKIFSKDVVKVRRKLFFVTNKTVESIIKDFLKSNEKKLFKGNKWSVVKIIAQNKVKLPTDKVDIKVSLLNETNFNRLPFLIEFMDKNHARLKSIRAYAIVDVKEAVVVATRNIYMRKVILPDMVEVKEIAIKNKNLNFIRNPREVIGKISKRYIRKGEPIYREIIQQPPMVKRGEIVNVIAVSRGITISSKGKVLENGFYNKPVRVLNLTSGKVFSAIVKSYGEVVVTF